MEKPKQLKKDFGQTKRNELYYGDWLKNYKLLIEYRTEYGHADVPARAKYKGVSLGNWVVRQRVVKKSLSKEQIKLLKAIGFDWRPRDNEWEMKVKLLLKFYQENGHTNVPIDFKKYPILARWVHSVRKLKAKNSLSDEKIRKLNHMHFIWDARNESWMQHLYQLKEFYSHHQHFYIPTNMPFKALSEWKNEQIRHFKAGKLSNERFQLLKEIGFDLTKKNLTDVKIVKNKKGKFERVIPEG